MDIDRFASQVNNPRRTKDELVQIRANAVAAGNVEFARIAQDALDNRFPGWNSVRSKRSGATPTTVSFRGDERRYPTAKEAYVWLIERFIQTYPEPFVKLNWEAKFFAKGRKRNYFGRDPRKMFHGSPHLASDKNNYIQLSNGWVVNLNLSNEQKFEILAKFAAVAKLQLGQEWKWQIEGGIDSDKPLEVRF